MKSLPLIRYVLIAAVRDRLVLGLLALLIVAASLSLFLGSAATIEKDQFVAVYAAGSIRALNVFGLVLFIVFFIRRSFESRDIDFMLSRPVGRIRLVVCYSAAFSIMAVILGAVSGAVVVGLSPHMVSEGYLLWTLSLVLENIIMVNVALFFSMILTSAASCAFSTLGFYVLARMMSQILGIIDSGKDTLAEGGLSFVMQLISMLMPRLDLMTQTSWLIYGPAEAAGIGFIFAQGLVYSVLILVAALIDMRFRQF